jgi:hypothetical protein
MSLAKVLGLIYFILAILFSPFVLLMMITEGPGLTEGIFAVIFVVLIYGIAGAIAGFLIGIIYNFIAKKFGGIEMEFETA